MILTYSSISAFKSCRRKYQYRYVDGIEQKDRPVYFDFGTAIHLALASHYRGAGPEAVTAEVEKYFADNAPAQDESERLGKWIEAREMVLAIYRNYIGHYPKETFKVLEIEIPFELSIGGENKLAGKIDMIADENGLWIVEHKSAKSIDANYKKKLTLDSQSLLYLATAELTYGKKFNGVIYNVLAKSLPTKPDLLKKGGLSKDKGKGFSPELYREAIKENGLQESDYAEFLEYLEDNRREYFYREYLTFTQEDREEWQREVFQILSDIIRATDENTFYKNTQQCVGFGTCPYFEICCAPDKQFVIENSYEKKAIHSELEKEEVF
jgi:polyhydroxyalkanoate synthesis regulator phasin